MRPELAIPSTSFLLWREMSDTYSRARLGGFYYLFVWGLLWFSSATPRQNLLIWSGGGLVLLGFFTLRRLHRPPEPYDSALMRRWLAWHWSIIQLHALTWGLMLAGIQLLPGISASHLIIMLSVVVFGTAIAFTFPMRMASCALAILLVYLPSTAIKYWQGIGDIGESIALMIYLAYLGLFLYRWNGEYRIGLERELHLLQYSEQLDLLSRTDTLTGLGNRYQFNTLLPSWLASARRYDTALSLILLDIDFFKRVNDRFGHSTGDLCLHAFAERMRQVFRRDSDILIRLGGEEFAVLMPDTALEQAMQLAERFRAELVAQPLELPTGHLSLTCSLGVGSFLPPADDSAESFYKRVDDALYRAKDRGRNRVEQA